MARNLLRVPSSDSSNECAALQRGYGACHMPIGRLAALVVILVMPSHAFAATFGHPVCTTAPGETQPAGDRVWQVNFGAAATAALEPRTGLAVPLAFSDTEVQGTPRAKAVEYSHGYEVRRKIHVYASVATLPLFVTQVVLGQKLYDQTASDSVKTAHVAVASSIAALFGVNTVTGVWNLKEGWKNPTHRGRRLAHGLMMLGADAGFVATGLLAPDRDDFESFQDKRGTHRAVALTSMGVATASYLMMLIWK
jgi:hypothetical protein